MEENSEVAPTNTDLSGKLERPIRAGRTLRFVTIPETVALVSRRLQLLSTPDSPHSTIDPSVVARIGSAASPLVLVLAELMDPSVEYPILVKRGDAFLRVHGDLELIPEFVDMVVLNDENGNVSYCPVESDIASRPDADTLNRMRYADELAKIRAAWA